MDFSWTDEQTAFKNSVVQFAQNDLEIDPDSTGFPVEAWKRCANFGVQGFNVPKQYGGQGLDILTTVLALEGFGYGCPDPGLSYAISAQMWSLQPALIHFGSEQQKQHYLSALCRAELIGAFAMTEPENGSDTANLKTVAKKNGDTYTINGAKEFVTFGPLADFALIFATTNPEHGAWGISAFLIDKDTPGFEQSGPSAKFGLHSTPLGEFSFNQCKVHESQRLGPEGVGMSLFAKVMEGERGYILTPHLGAMERQLEHAVAFAKKRRQFGQSIGKNQSVSNRLVDMKLRLELAKLMVYKTAWLDHTGQSLQMEAPLTKLCLSEFYVISSLDSIRTYGARGFLKKYDVGGDLMDAVGSLIYGGTADIQRVVIARLLGL